MTEEVLDALVLVLYAAFPISLISGLGVMVDGNIATGIWLLLASAACLLSAKGLSNYLIESKKARDKLEVMEDMKSFRRSDD